MSKIINLKSENVKRLKAVEITPDGNLVVIGGKNGAGKTSVLDSIMYALGGSKSLPTVPVHKGEEKAVVELDLGDIVVKRTFTSAGGGQLTVTNKDGLKYPSPQAILDGLVGRLSFDPLEFARQEPVVQAETLRTLVGLDFKEINERKKKLYDERTVVGRELKSLESRLAALPKPVAGLPKAEVSATDILEEQRAASEQNAANAKQRQLAADAQKLVEDCADAVQECCKSVADCESEIERLTTLLKRQQDILKGGQENVKLAEKEHADAVSKAKQLKDAADKLKDADLAPFQTRAQEVEAVNKKVRDAASYATLGADVKKKKADQEALTKKIDAADDEKRKLVAAAKFPIDGLTVDEAGAVVFNDVPFTQASSAEQLRVSVAIGLALNPKLRVLLIRDGSLLDDENLKVVSEMAATRDAQIWLERVGTGGEVSVIIEDGMVKA